MARNSMAVCYKSDNYLNLNPYKEGIALVLYVERAIGHPLYRVRRRHVASPEEVCMMSTFSGLGLKRIEVDGSTRVSLNNLNPFSGFFGVRFYNYFLYYGHIPKEELVLLEQLCVGSGAEMLHNLPRRPFLAYHFYQYLKKSDHPRGEVFMSMIQ